MIRVRRFGILFGRPDDHGLGLKKKSVNFGLDYYFLNFFFFFLLRHECHIFDGLSHHTRRQKNRDICRTNRHDDPEKKNYKIEKIFNNVV